MKWSCEEIQVCKKVIHDNPRERLSKVAEKISNELNRTYSSVRSFLIYNLEIIDFRKEHEIFTNKERRQIMDDNLYDEDESVIDDEGNFKIDYKKFFDKVKHENKVAEKFIEGEKYAIYDVNKTKEKFRCYATLVDKDDRFARFKIKTFCECFLWNDYGVGWKAKEE